MPPTVGTLDSLANEAIRTVHEGVDSFKFLFGKNELESATKRLQEAFLIGEYMPEIRELPRDQKRQALEFAQKTNQLLSSLDVKDYSLAEKLVKELNELAKDCDTSKATAAIETARTVSKMHLAKATNAAVRGDRETLEAEFKEAAAIWPRNPDLEKVATHIYSEADVQQQALTDFDQLLSQHNYRQIYDDRIRFIAATALDPTHGEKLKKVLEDMQAVEGAVIRCNEIAKSGNNAGAWENAERMTRQYPDDNKLNQLLAKLSTEASEFVHTIRTAQQLEEKDQTGSSLAWYLKAQKIYPPSEFAQEGIQRLLKKILPAS
jgi:tetratricopeptide (TPR) repeat protein